MATSEIFWDAFIDGGSHVAECVCGRMNFSTSERNDWDEGELEELINKSEKNPDKYIAHGDCDSVAIAMIQGNPVCYGCSCNYAEKYEKFLENHESEILSYYKRKANEAWSIATKKQAKLQAIEEFKWRS